MYIEDLFNIRGSKSRGYSSHPEGDVPFVSNGTYNNGVVGFVSPLSEEKVFENTSITVSAFGDAIVQKGPFIPRGNGGSGLTVLEPKEDMSLEGLYAYAAQINAQKWRFSYSRMVTKDRIKQLTLNRYETVESIDDSIKSLIPKNKTKTNPEENPYKWFNISDLCNINKSSAVPQNQMGKGTTPYVTTSSKNNGISDYVNEEPNAKSKCVTVSLNGSVGEAFFQFDDFVTSGDNAILTLKEKYNPYLLLFITFLVRRQRWRYNYYRKLTLPKLKKMLVPLPVADDGESINETYIKRVFDDTYGFELVQKYL